MAESPSSDLPGGVQWLPAIGGAHLLRAEVGRGEPPTLVLQSARGGEHHIAPGPQTRFSRSADFLIPAGLRWSVAALVWPHGGRAVLPEPPAGRAEVIDLASRRPAPPTSPPADKPAPIPWTAARPDEPGEPPGAATAPSPPGPAGSSVTPAAPPLSAPGPVGSSLAAPSPPGPVGSSLAAPSSPGLVGSSSALGPAGSSSVAPSSPGPVGSSSAAPSLRGPVGSSSSSSAAAAPLPLSRPAGLSPGSAKTLRPVAPGSGGAETAIPASRAGEVTGTDVAADGYQAARADLQADLSRAVEALSHAQETELVADGAVQAILTGARSDLQAERAARAADLSVLGAQSQLIELRAELQRARDEITQLRTALESERLARVAAEAALGTPVPPGDLSTLAAAQTDASAVAPRRSPEEADRLVAALEAAASSLRASVPAPQDDAAPVDEGVRSETFLEGKFATAPPAAADDVAPPPAEVADLAEPAPAAPPSGMAEARDPAEPAQAAPSSGPAEARDPAELAPAAAPSGPADARDPAELAPAAPSSGPAEVADSAGIASTPPVGEAIEPVVDHRPVLVASVAARAAAEAARQALAPVVVPAPGLRRALVTLAHDEPLTAAALIAGLLPAQAAILGDEPLSYDLTVRGYGTFAVTLGPDGTEVQRLTKRRRRKEAAFHVSGEPLVLAQLLAGERKRLGRFRPSARITGRRWHARHLRAALPASTLSLAEAVSHGARLEPSLVYAALPYTVAPEWTKGHVFTIAQEIHELAPRAWYVTARDGVRLSVVEHAQGAAADATVTMSRAAFDRLLANEPPAPGDLPVIRGDRDAVAALKHWTDLARGRS